MAARSPCGRSIHANRDRLSEADRLHRHNEEMRLALSEGLSLAEARWRLFEQRMEAADRARDGRLAQIDDRSREAPGSKPRFWWERD